MSPAGRCMNEKDLNSKIEELEDALKFFQDEKCRLKAEFVFESSPNRRFEIRKHEEEADSSIHRISEALGILKDNIIESEIEANNKNNVKTKQKNIPEPNSMKIFISHAEADSHRTELLVNFLLSSLQIAEDQIRCTSVPGHQLPFRNNISELLKTDLQLSPVIMTLITKTSLASTWVMFELGAAWALNKTIIPIIAPSLTHRDLPGPLANNTCIQIGNFDTSSRIRDALKQISLELKIEEKTGGKSQSNLDKFLAACKV